MTAAAAPTPMPGECHSANLEDQVSFVIRHTVKPGRHEEYEKWLHKTIAIAARQPGHMGAHVAAPSDGSDVYQIAVRFATREDAERWMRSAERRDLVHEVEQLIREPEALDIKSGIDYWFASATGASAPPRWKQWFLTLTAVWPLSMLLPLVLDHVYAAVPVLGRFGVRHLVQGMCLVFLLTYVVMPPYTRAMRKWLTRA